MLCLDTNVVVAAIAKRPAMVSERLQDELAHGVGVLVPAVVLFELRFGIAKSARREANMRALQIFLSAPIETPPFDDADASDAADIRLFLQRKGTPIGPYDTLIAAQARRRGASLVTANVREFRRVPGTVVQDWTAE